MQTFKQKKVEIFLPLKFGSMVYNPILCAMKEKKYLTVAEYAKFIGKSVPLVYKQIRLGQVKMEEKYGRYLIVVEPVTAWRLNQFQPITLPARLLP